MIEHFVNIVTISNLVQSVFVATMFSYLSAKITGVTTVVIE